jgi:hypothetical protein
LKLKKIGTRIVAIDNQALFYHCAGCLPSIHESEFPSMQKVLMAHNVDIVNLIDDGEE